MNRENPPPSREPGTRYTLSMPSMPPASGSDLPNSDSRLPDLLPGGAALAHLIAQAEASFRAARAGSTLRAYAHDWKQFRLWAERHRLDPDRKRPRLPSR